VVGPSTIRQAQDDRGRAEKNPPQSPFIKGGRYESFDHSKFDKLTLT
jgi:hypothetical protein